MNPPIIILAGGGTTLPRDPLPAARIVIAADSGLHLAEPLGLTVDVLVGDLDSVDEDRVSAAVDAGTSVIRHPTGKDHTDLDLALEEARRRGGGRVVVVGGVDGDRLDHLLATIGLLGSERYDDLEIEWWDDTATVWVTRGHLLVDGAPGDLLTIIPASAPIVVSVEGVRWPLSNAALEFGATLGVSNEITSPPAEITVSSGTAFVVHIPRRGSP